MPVRPEPLRIQKLSQACVNTSPPQDRIGLAAPNKRPEGHWMENDGEGFATERAEGSSMQQKSVEGTLQDAVETCNVIIHVPWKYTNNGNV